MTDIKMSEVFELPVDDLFIMPEIRSCTHQESSAAAIAINAYDANQELIDTMGAALAAMTETIVRRDQEIAELKRLVDFDTKAILKDGDTIDDQQQEIAKLKQALKLNDDEIANSEAIKTSIAALTDAKIKEQQQEIADLKTKNDNLALNVASLKSQADRQVKMYNDQVDEIAELKAKLQSVKADASIDFARHLLTEYSQFDSTGVLGAAHEYRREILKGKS